MRLFFTLLFLFISTSSFASSQDPLDDFSRIDSTFERMMSDSLRRMMDMSESIEISKDDIQISEREDPDYKYIEIKAENDLSKDSIKVDVRDGMISLSGEIKKVEKIEKKGLNSFSTSISSFSKAFSVPSGVNADKAEIDFDGKKIIIKFPRDKV